MKFFSKFNIYDYLSIILILILIYMVVIKDIEMSRLTRFLLTIAITTFVSLSRRKRKENN